MLTVKWDARSPTISSSLGNMLEGSCSSQGATTTDCNKWAALSGPKSFVGYNTSTDVNKCRE